MIYYLNGKFGLKDKNRTFHCNTECCQVCKHRCFGVPLLKAGVMLELIVLELRPKYRDNTIRVPHQYPLKIPVLTVPSGPSKSR